MHSKLRAWRNLTIIIIIIITFMQGIYSYKPETIGVSKVYSIAAVLYLQFVLYIMLFRRYSDWLRAGRSGIESRWGRDFTPVQTGHGAHPASCKMGTGSSPGVKCGRGVLLTTHPLLVPWSWTSRAIPLPTLWATPGL